ncbi:MAG: thiamine pyrophosphate-dependent enzyme, partial [Oscillospiraceae bacterium]|nr:thiamine pyrophosphate-dependent enzyme [Oscillospiraceae bacterium]
EVGKEVGLCPTTRSEPQANEVGKEVGLCPTTRSEPQANEVGVCVATSGPGAANLITAIATAYMDSVPIVAITGQVNTPQIGTDAFQEADITGAVESFVKHSYLVKDANELPRIVREAFHIAATGRPGPVLIDIPMDVQLTDIGEDFNYPDTVNVRGYKPSVSGNKLQIKRVAEAIEAAQKPLICAGGGAVAVADLVKKLSEKADIPVVHTLMGTGLGFGMIGMHGKPAANHALAQCDLLIILGARVNDRAIPAGAGNMSEKKIVHVDVDPAEIGKNHSVAIPVVGDIKNVLEQVLELVPSKSHSDWRGNLSGFALGLEAKGTEPSPVRVFYAILNRLMPDDTIVTADVGQNQIWTANNIELGKGGRFLTSGGMGTMGYSVPAAIGAKRAAPEKEVIAICGDGSFQMQFMELATAVQHGINIKVIIMSNGRLGMVREVQKLRYDNNLTAVFLDGSPDFVKLAAAYGIAGERLTDMKAADKALIALLASKKPYVLVVDVDAEERSLLGS